MNELRVDEISAFRAGRKFGRKIRFNVSFAELIYRDPADESETWEAKSRDFSTFAEAKAFADLMGEARLRLYRGALGIAHVTSKAGFPKRGPDTVSDQERAELVKAGFDLEGIA